MYSTVKRKNRACIPLWVSHHLRSQFKAYCARRGKTMTAVLEEAMLEKVKQDLHLNLNGKDDGK